MGTYAQAGVPNNKVVKLIELDGAGLNLIDIKNIGDVNLVAAYVKRSTDTNLRNLTDTRVTGESAQDGGALDSTPIAPGSLVLTATGVPTLVDKDRDGVLYLDRVVGSVLASGTDGVTSAAATRTLTSAGGDFITDGVVAGDKVHVSGADGASGEYTIVTVAATVLTVSRPWDVGGNTSVVYAVKASEIAAGTVNYFTGLLLLDYPSSPSVASPVNKGSVLGTVAFPINLDPDDTLIVDIDGVGDATATFLAGRATKAGAKAGFAASAGETVNIKINDEAVAQPIVFGSGTEDTPAKYADLINSQLIGGKVDLNLNSLAGMIGVLNEMKINYDAHRVLLTSHRTADATNDVTAADATDLATAQTLANDIKAQYNAHLGAASEMDEAVTLVNELRTDYEAHRAATANHPVADAVNTIGAAVATNLATAIALANDLRVQYEAHRVEATIHENNDTTNTMTAPACSDLTTLKALANDLQTTFNAHCAALSELEECITLLNEIKADYNVHITTIDTIHDVADVANPIAAADATDLATAQTLANELKTDYNLHRSQAGVHPNNDAGNDITSANATNLATLITLANELKTDYNAHCAAASEVEECITILTEITTDYPAHIADVASHDAADVTNVLSYAAPTDLAECYLSANDIKAKYNAHRSDAGHVNTDAGNEVTSPDATTPLTLITLANEIKADFNAHCAAASELEECITLVTEMLTDYEAHRVDTTSHVIADAVNTLASVVAPTNFAECVTRTSDLVAKYMAHRSQAGVHVNNDAGNAITSTEPATTQAELELLCNELKLDMNAHMAAESSLEEAIVLLNEIKADYNAHRVDITPVHGAADAVNDVTAADATDLATAYTLANDIKVQYEAHRVTLGGVHDNADAANPIGSANATTLLTLVTLTNELKTDINLHMVAPSTLEEAITMANEMRGDYEAHRILTAGGVHGAVDSTNVLSAPAATDLTTCMALANDIKATYNAHKDFVAGGVHVGADPGNEVTSADATNIATLETLLNEMKGDYNAHIVVQPAVHGAADAVNGTAAANVGTADIHKEDDVSNTIGSPASGASAIHYIDDSTNTTAAADVGAAAVHIIDDVTNTIAAVNAGTAGIHIDDDATNVATSDAAQTAAVHHIDDATNTSTEDAVGTLAVHLESDSLNLIAAANATNLATLRTLVTELIADYALHLAATAAHVAADATNVLTEDPDTLDLLSDQFGTGSKVEIVSGTGTILTKLGWAAGTAVGTGDADNINAVTFIEAKAVIEAGIANSLCQSEGGALRLLSDTATEDAASTVNVNAAGTATTKFGLSTTIATGADPTAKQPVSALYTQSTLITSPGHFQQKIPGPSNRDVVDVYFAANGRGKVRVEAEALRL